FVHGVAGWRRVSAGRWPRTRGATPDTEATRPWAPSVAVLGGGANAAGDLIRRNNKTRLARGGRPPPRARVFRRPRTGGNGAWPIRSRRRAPGRGWPPPCAHPGPTMPPRNRAVAPTHR